MNIASVTAVQPPANGKVEASNGSLGVDGGAETATDAPDAGGVPGFGRLLAQRMDSGGVTDLPSADRKPVAPGKTLPDAVLNGLASSATSALQTAAATPSTATMPSSDAGLAAIDRGAGVVVPRSADMDGGPTRRGAQTVDTGVDTGDDGTPVDDAARHDGDAIGNDLAAQLALVSQWAALTTPAPTATPATAGTSVRVGDGAPDVRVAATIGRGGPSVPIPATAADTVPDPALPAAASFPETLSLQKGEGAPVLSTGAMPTTKPIAPKTGEPGAKDRTDATQAADTIVPKTARETLAALATVGGPHGSGFTVPVESSPQANGAIAVPAAQAPGGAAPSVQAAATPVLLRESVGTPAWSHEVGQATLRMVSQDLQTASLRLNPDHLGPVDVQVRIDNGVASLSFDAAHAQTRHALEASRTTLDQMFADQGIKVGDWSVGDSGASQRGFGDAQAGAMRRDSGGRSGGTGAGSPDDSTGTTTVTARISRAAGLVDTFA